MKAYMKRVLPFLFSFVILCVFAVQCFRAPSVGASDVFSVSPYVFGDYNKTDYEITLDNITAPGIVFCMAEYAYGTPSESVNVSFSGVDSINIISNDYIGSSGVESADCTAYVFWAYVTDIESITITVYNSLSRDNTFFGFIPNCDTIDYLSLDEVSAGGNYKMELAEGNNYLISYTALNNGALLNPLVQCNAVLVGAKPRRTVYMYDGTTPSTVTYTPRSVPGAMAVYRVYDSSAVGGGTGTDTGQEQLEVSNNILTNIKNILQYIANLPSNIYGAFSALLLSLKDEITSIPDKIIDKLVALFIPTANIFARIIVALDEKYPIVQQCVQIFAQLFNDIGTAEPKFEMTWKGINFAIIDFTSFSAHMPLIRNVTAAFLWLAFITHEVRTLPKLIRGRD